MTTAISEYEGPREYTLEEVQALIKQEGVRSEADFSYVAAVDTYALFVEHEGDHVLASRPGVSVRVIETTLAQTGYFVGPKAPPLIVLRKGDLLHYDLISELHPFKDCDVYLYLPHPWEATDNHLSPYEVWYRREVYKDKMEPFEGVLGPADLPEPGEGAND